MIFTPQRKEARKVEMLTWMPATISLSSEAASRTVTSAPALRNAIAAARPPIPAPQRPIWMDCVN